MCLGQSSLDSNLLNGLTNGVDQDGFIRKWPCEETYHNPISAGPNLIGLYASETLEPFTAKAPRRPCNIDHEPWPGQMEIYSCV